MLNPTTAAMEDFRSVRQDLNDVRRKVEKKADLRERLQRSPDDMDACLLAAAMPASLDEWVTMNESLANVM